MLALAGIDQQPLPRETDPHIKPSRTHIPVPSDRELQRVRGPALQIEGRLKAWGSDITAKKTKIFLIAFCSPVDDSGL